MSCKPSVFAEIIFNLLPILNNFEVLQNNWLKIIIWNVVYYLIIASIVAAKSTKHLASGFDIIFSFVCFIRFLLYLWFLSVCLL